MKNGTTLFSKMRVGLNLRKIGANRASMEIAHAVLKKLLSNKYHCSRDEIEMNPCKHDESGQVWEFMQNFRVINLNLGEN